MTEQPFQPAPKPEKHRNPKAKTALIGTGVFLLGLVFGSAAASGSSSTPEPVVETKTVEVPGPVRTETVETKVEVTPESCRAALHAADKVIAAAGEGFAAASDGFTAVSELDPDKLAASNQKMAGVSADLQTLRPEYEAAKNACNAK